VLMPLTAEALRRVCKPFVGGNDVKAFLASFVVLNFLIIFAGFWLLFRYLSIWFPDGYALGGVLFSACSMLVGFSEHFYQPWSLLEPALFTLGLLLLYRHMYIVFGIVIALATLNRETGILLALAYPVVNLFLPADRRTTASASSRRLWLSLIFLLIWATIYAGLRLTLGNVAHIHDLAYLWHNNLQRIASTLTYMMLFFGLAWVFAIAGIKRAPFFVRRTLWLIVPFAALFLVFGNWYEVRLLMTLYPLLLPPLLAYFAPLKEERPA